MIRLAVGLEVGSDLPQDSIREICDIYHLTLIPEMPPILFKQESKLIFFCQLEDQLKGSLDALEGDLQVEGIWLDPEFISMDFTDPEMVNRLNQLLRS